jgi:acetylornithine deacetylase
MLLHLLSARTDAEVSRGAVIAIAAGAMSCQGALANLAGDVVARDHCAARNPDPFTAVLACLRRLRHAAAAAELHVEAVVLAIPARLDPDRGLTVSVVDDGWDGLDLRSVLAEHAVELVQIETDVRLAALAQAWRGEAPPGGDFVTLSLGDRVGCAIVADGGDIAASRLTLDVRDRIMDALDPEHALDLLRTVIAMPSPSGEEFYLAGVVAGELHALGFDQVRVDRFAPGRAGTSGVMRGTGGGDALLLAAHLDTAGTDGWADRWRRDEREDPFAAIIADGALWGRGAAASKGGLAAALAALWTLARAGFRPRGDLVLACVADRRAGGDGTGLSRGMRKIEAQLRNGELPRPDFALYLEPTGLAVHATQTGFLSVRLGVRPRDGATDPRRAALAIATALNEHARALARGTIHPLLGSASLEVGEIQDRGVSGIAMQLLRSVLPGERLDEAAAAIETVVAGARGPRIETKITYLGGRDHSLGGRPFEVSSDEPGVARLRGAIRTVRPGGGQIRGATSWSELSFITELGVPGAYFSPGLEAHRDSLEERVSVEDHLDAVRALALFIAEHCLTAPAPPHSGHADEDRS